MCTLVALPHELDHPVTVPCYTGLLGIKCPRMTVEEEGEVTQACTEIVLRLLSLLTAVPACLYLV